MKNILEVLRQKETDLQQIQKEIEALRIAARLLSEESDIRTEPVVRPTVLSPSPETLPRPKPATQVFEASLRQFP
jgi:hypothetical protein